MSTFRRFASSLFTVAWLLPANAQISAPDAFGGGPFRNIYDASNTELPASSFRQEERMGPGSKGTISVQELLHPLGGKGLRAIQKAEALLAKGESVKAMESLRAAMRYPDAEPHALGLLGTEHLKKGDLDTAILELEHAVQMLPSTAAFQSNLALALALRGRNEEGLIVARKALKLNPGAAKTRYVMAHLLLRMGYRDEAEFHLKMAAAEFPAARMTLNQYFSK